MHAGGNHYGRGAIAGTLCRLDGIVALLIFIYLCIAVIMDLVVALEMCGSLICLPEEAAALHAVMPCWGRGTADAVLEELA